MELDDSLVYLTRTGNPLQDHATGAPEVLPIRSLQGAEEASL